MLRVSSLLMMIVLAAPMVSDCCLPTTRAPFDESKHSDDEGCFWSDQAIAETKGTVAARITVEYRLPFMALLISETLGSARHFKHEGELTRPQDGIDLYLRNGTLRI
jgi:hypothetical protein